MMMMMMIMTQMKLVNSATKFRHGMDKFYQPNSGLRSSRSLDEAIYTYIINGGFSSKPRLITGRARTKQNMYAGCGFVQNMGISYSRDRHHLK